MEKYHSPPSVCAQQGLRVPIVRYARAGQWIEHLLAYKIAHQKPSKLLSLASPGIILKGLNLSCKANECSDAGTGNLGVPTTNERLSNLLAMLARSTTYKSRMPHGWHTLDIECKGVLSIGV